MGHYPHHDPHAGNFQQHQHMMQRHPQPPQQQQQLPCKCCSDYKKKLISHLLRNRTKLFFKSQVTIIA